MHMRRLVSMLPLLLMRASSDIIMHVCCPFPFAAAKCLKKNGMELSPHHPGQSKRKQASKRRIHSFLQARTST